MARYGPLQDKENPKHIFIAVSKYFSSRWKHSFQQPSLPLAGWFCLSYNRSTTHAPSLARLLRGGGGGESPMNYTPQICYFKLGWRSRELEEIYKTRSQIAGWTLMLTPLPILFVSMSIRRCFLRRKHFSLPNIECCYQLQVKEALKKCHAKGKEMAKEETNREICELLHNVEK